MAEIRPYCPNGNTLYLCPYCNGCVRLIDAGVVIDAFLNVCHQDCLLKARGTSEPGGEVGTVAEIKLCGLLYVNLAAGPITCERPLGHMGGHSAVVPSMPNRTIHWGGAPVPDGAVAEIATWRVGARIPLNVYEGSRAVCQCHTPEDAARIVLAMNRYGRDAWFPMSIVPVPSFISDGAPFVPDGYWCQNCSRVPVEAHGGICSWCINAARASARPRFDCGEYSDGDGIPRGLKCNRPIGHEGKHIAIDPHTSGLEWTWEQASTILEQLTPASSRCGHNFNIPKCPYRHCAARELYAIVEDIRATLQANGYTSIWMAGKTTDDMAAALKKARGEE